MVLSQEPRSIDKIAEIDTHIACANSGLSADSRTLIEHARVETQVFFIHCMLFLPEFSTRKCRVCACVGWVQLCHHRLCWQPPNVDHLSCLQQHRFTYNEPMPVESCTQSLCDLALRFGEDGEEDTMVRKCSSLAALLGKVS